MDDWKDVAYYFSLLGQTGIVMLLSIVLSMFIYKGIELLIGENLFIFLVCILLGIFSGGYSVYKLIFKG